ncbi:MAG: ATP-dependent RNA helicase HrpA [Planctomycetaceae bacterium]|nr:ATP-dependent RNA helicase HrpA [Planctomycetaceae bacterium]
MSSDLPELESALSQAMACDRFRLRRRINQLKSAEKSGKPFDKRLDKLKADVDRSVDRRSQRQKDRPKINFEGELPVLAQRDEIAAAIREHQVVVVCGETGSGKSTQLPKICLDLGRGVDGLIGHTQPRRIAARSVAARIADEMGKPLGQEVGFKIRFTDTTRPKTYIKLMTDGILLAESQHDRFLDQYDTIIIDEAHERSLNIDFLIGFLKRLLPRRRDLKVIITSATIDAERFSEHFSVSGQVAPIVEVAGRVYPVEVRYRPIVEQDDEDAGNNSDPDWLRGIADAVNELSQLDDGDVLIFMPTERDIHDVAKLLRGRRIKDRSGKNTEILPLYARLSTKEQNRVFTTSNNRRIVIATNVAESSLTVPGIRYVIDPGTARISRYSARSKMQRLPIEPISRASADQRMGRCGRIGPGVCIRLYSEQDYNNRDRFTPPEIQRTNLASVILQTKALRLGEIDSYPFLDPPKPTTVRAGYRTLFELGALDGHNNLTEFGKRLSRLPVDPRIGRIILAGHDENCLHEVLIIGSALEIRDPRERPIDKQEAADRAHEQFAHEDSDFLGYLKLWDFYQGLKKKLSRNQMRKACRQNFLSYNRMREWQDVHRQLLQLVESAGLKQHRRQDDSTAIHKALLAGLLSSVAVLTDKFEYTAVGGNKVFLWPGSAMFEKKPKWVVAAELVETTKRYLRTVGKIQPEWIESLAEHLVTRNHSEPHWVQASGAVMAYEKVSLSGLTIVPKRRVPFGPIDPKVCREIFIHYGLVEGELNTDADFLLHNLQLIEDLEALQSKSRRRDLMLGKEARYEFFDRIIPSHVFDATRFKKWRRKVERKTPKLLFLTKADVTIGDTEPVVVGSFPDQIQVQHMQLPLEYSMDPGEEHDGITLTIPQEGLNQLDDGRLGWLVPGLLEEKIVAMIKSLPKSLRRMLVPAPENAKRVFEELEFGDGDFLSAVASRLSQIAGEVITANDFDGNKLPNHLKMNVRVVDGDGKTLANGRNVQALRGELGTKAAAAVADAAEEEWNQEGLTDWTFGDLPNRITLNRGGVAIEAFPTLIDNRDGVALRLADTLTTAAFHVRSGLRRLFCLANQRYLKEQTDWLPNWNQIRLNASTLSYAKELKQHVSELIADRALFFRDAPVPRNEEGFRKLAAQGKQNVSLAVQDVAKLLPEIMSAYQAARLALEEKYPANWSYALSDMKEQISQLMEDGFLCSTPWYWLQQYPRYLNAIPFRLKKMRSGSLGRDQQSMELLLPRWDAYLHRRRELTLLETHDAELDQFRWMLEEYRVSLFAQELRTAIKISDTRLDKQWSKVKVV